MSTCDPVDAVAGRPPFDASCPRARPAAISSRQASKRPSSTGGRIRRTSSVPLWSSSAATTCPPAPEHGHGDRHRMGSNSRRATATRVSRVTASERRSGSPAVIVLREPPRPRADDHVHDVGGRKRQHCLAHRRRAGRVVVSNALGARRLFDLLHVRHLKTVEDAQPYGCATRHGRQILHDLASVPLDRQGRAGRLAAKDLQVPPDPVIPFAGPLQETPSEA